jgi:hypothetical protein
MGIVLKSFRQINTGVNQLLEPEAFAQFRVNAGAYNNRALFEIPEFLEEVLQRNDSAAATLGISVSVNAVQQKTPFTPPPESSFAK